MARWNLAVLLAVPVLVIGGLTIAMSAPPRERDKDYQLIRLLVDVLAEVDQHYVRELSDADRKKLVENMINGGLTRLDDYSAYFNTEDMKQFEAQTDGNFGGVGIQIGVDPKTGELTVISPMVGTPAFDAGILAGDTIEKIGDKLTLEMRMDEAIRMIQGPPGTDITLTVRHEGSDERKTVTLKRAKIEIHTVMGYRRMPGDAKQWDWFVAPEIGYIRLTQFNDKTVEDLRTAVKAIEAAKGQSLILDLRDNPGGLLSSAIEVCDMFLNEGKIVSTKDRLDTGRSWEARPGDTLFEPAATHKIVVLINKNSASASEIVSAALQDHHRAVVIGERSFGKGSVQNVIKLPSDPTAGLKLTTASYWRPSGENIHRDKTTSKDTDTWGVKPDAGMEIKLTDEERLAYLKHRRERDIIREKPVKDTYQDRAMEKALEVLKK